MFYSQCLVSRKGPLGAIWVAAYFFKKLKKAQVKATHIPSSVDQILQKELDALTYRVLAYLLLGVVRIYSKKVDFLFDDCNKALIGVKEFVAKEKNREKTGVSLPASIECFSIALPERFELDAFDLGILEDFHGGNVKPHEDITLKDGSQEPESMDMYSMERFDMEEDLLFTFHETFSANHNENKHESFAHDMDMDAENVRDTTEEASVRVVEAEPLDSTESSRDHQNASRHREHPESDDILVEPQMSEDIRRAQEEDTFRETISTIVQRLVDPHESSGDNLRRDGYIENLESEKTSCEEMQHEGSLPSECVRPEAIHRIEDQLCGATRINGEKEIPEMSTLEEPEPVSVTGSRDSPECVEKCRDHNEAEMGNFELLHGSHKEQSDTSEVNLHGSEKGFLSDMTVSKDPSRGFNAANTPVAVTPKTPSRVKISEGGTSPQFSIIPTPAAKESSRVSRKRKCLIDDEVLIPNKVMKEMIEDSSKLLAKRRNVPHTDCPERRTKRFANPFRSFLEPLIQYGSSDLQSLFCQPIKLKNWATTGTPRDAKIARRKENSSLDTVRTPGVILSSDQTENTQEIMETPQAAALAGLKVTAGNSNMVSVEMGASSITSGTAHQTENAAETPLKPSVIAPETPVRTSEQTEIAPETPVVSEQVEIAPETPVRESMSKRFFKDPETCYKKSRPASPFTSFEEHPSVYYVENRDLDMILMNDEVNADETHDLQQETWSARTRNVAKFLEKTFVEQREREEEEKVSLLQLCRGRTQKESASLFYETLVLKTKGYLEVKQNRPYSDVLLTPFARQQKAC
ncbi:unnamed protein product [Arabidopsis lyrata]|uniref:Sister chromatid cohesion 1 protein 2 n=1 Tax=Arabidopsis lyrata subsp. lyrata TaxID=81972 RepID=D7MJ21_ARALL|nr:sister chromatid cohesion 1 protein 2 isoform X2 [Arabidopsis lyrata subsp. lyrata]EFH44885.1 hypothetical protein ARALYDRAFT_493894 [Arabidopsis lyrata subsp. lyrata]CAH8277714.1 unnamed protein product [Arabidopsis lyrata]|eukprot:XP_020875223.1 sister chromatid cohesion 1 protein 2 isoform X2 [Arabidopsis lyrata subsp. lyrata]